jgi:hypothetical protein
MVYESDTEEVMVYTSAGTWRRPWKMPWGVMASGYVEATANQTGITTGPTDLTSLTLTNTFVANRRIRITFKGSFVANAGAGLVEVYLREGATNISQFGNFAKQNATDARIVHGAVVLTPTAASHAYKVSVTCNAFAVDLNANALPGNPGPAWMSIEDMGPNGAAA